MIKRILIVTAMESETLPLCEKLSLTHFNSSFAAPMTCSVFFGIYNAVEIFLAWSGRDPVHNVDNIGSQPATLTTFLCIKEFSPDLVLSIGTAGGFCAQGTQVNDVFVSKKHVIFHGRRIDVAIFKNYGIGFYPCVDIGALALELGLKEGIISTGDSFAHDQQECDYIKSLGSNVVEMESAAVGWVCSLFNTPFIALKLIVNLLDGPEPAHEEFIKNLDIGCIELKNKAYQLISNINKLNHIRR